MMTARTAPVALTWFGLALTWFGLASGANPYAPHPHQGKIAPFKPGRPDVRLRGAEEASLDEGNLVMFMTKDASGVSGRATAVQAVHAPPKFVWRQLLDFNSYPRKVDKLQECSKYFDKQNIDGTRQIKVRFLVKAAPGFAFEYWCDHTHNPLKKSLTWSLDYSRDNDFDDVQGHWYVCPHPSKEDWSHVYYSADLALKGWVPGFVMKILTNTALKSAVSWVKRESELEWTKEAARNRAGSAGGRPKLPAFKGFGGMFKEPPPPPPPPQVVEEAKKNALSQHAKLIAIAAGGSVAVAAGAALAHALFPREGRSDAPASPAVS